MPAAHGHPRHDGPSESPLIDPDVDLSDPRQRVDRRQWDLLLATSLGGILGAEARYGLDVALPHETAQFPWSTVVINASGCLLIGALMVVLIELVTPHRLVRPFLGVGILGGYTTYSTFAEDAQRLLREHRVGIALAYVAGTLLACGAAVVVGSYATRVAARSVRARRSAPPGATR